MIVFEAGTVRNYFRMGLGAPIATMVSMNRAFQTRLAILVATMGFVAALTLLGLHWSFKRIGRLERQLTRNQFETFRLAEEFQAQMRLLNNSILRYAAG